MPDKELIELLKKRNKPFKCGCRWVGNMLMMPASTIEWDDKYANQKK